MRYIYILLLALAACSAPIHPEENPFAGWTSDSIKHALETHMLSGRVEMLANGNLGILYIVAGAHDSARIYLNRALSLPGGRELQGGRYITNLANSYGFQGQYAEALKYYMEALDVAERLVATGRNVTEGEANTVRTAANLSELFYHIGHHDRALHYAFMGQRLLEKGAQSVFYVKPQLLWVSGAVQLERGELDEAAATMDETSMTADSLALIISAGGDPKAGGMWWYSAYGREGQAQVALRKGDTEAALAFATDALRYAERHGDPTVTARIYAALSDVHLAKGDYESGGRYARQALDMFPDYLKLNPGMAFNIASTNLFAGDKKKAYDYFRLYSERMKENTDRQFRETMAGMEVVYETEKKETRIASLEKQRLLYLLLCIVGMLFILALWMFFRQKIRQQQKDKQLAAANAVVEWEKKERKRFAGDLHDGINGMLSAMKLELGAGESTQSIRGRIDDCIETIRRMSRGMMPGSLERYGLKAALEDYCRLFPNVEFHFFGEDRRIGEQLELTVYYCAYELVNNSFRHSGAKHIHVQLVQDDGSVSLTVQDDGCGFGKPHISEGSGLKNIRDRVATFNGRIDITSSPGEGTETSIELRVENGEWRVKN